MKHLLSILFVVFVTSCGSSNRFNASVKNINTLEYAKVIPHEFPLKSNLIKDDSIAVVNDPFYTRNWGIKASSASQAWQIEKGNKNVVVAVIDTGVDVFHEDLKNSLWRNSGEIGLDKNGNAKETNGIDDDGNGYIDDVHGWNFADNTSKLKDINGHGTHIAGIIAASDNNKKGSAGIAPNVSIMVVKYYGSDLKNSTEPLEASLKSLRYAIDNGATIINYSGGGEGFVAQEKRLLKEADEKGIIVVAAAGNKAKNTDRQPFYPASYKLNNIISVTSIDKNNNLTKSSSYGANNVDLAAPGEKIYSTLPGNKYGFLTGTSQATAFVTGAVSLMKSRFPKMNMKEIKNKLIAATRLVASLSKNVSSSGVLDVANCLLSTIENTEHQLVSVAAPKLALK